MSDDTWSCPHCTFENPSKARKCGMCDFGRSENVQDVLRQRELLSNPLAPARKKQSTSKDDKAVKSASSTTKSSRSSIKSVDTSTTSTQSARKSTKSTKSKADQSDDDDNDENESDDEQPISKTTKTTKSPPKPPSKAPPKTTPKSKTTTTRSKMAVDSSNSDDDAESDSENDDEEEEALKAPPASKKKAPPARKSVPAAVSQTTPQSKRGSKTKTVQVVSDGEQDDDEESADSENDDEKTKKGKKTAKAPAAAPKSTPVTKKTAKKVVEIVDDDKKDEESDESPAPVVKPTPKGRGKGTKAAASSKMEDKEVDDEENEEAKKEPKKLIEKSKDDDKTPIKRSRSTGKKVSEQVETETEPPSTTTPAKSKATPKAAVKKTPVSTTKASKSTSMDDISSSNESTNTNDDDNNDDEEDLIEVPAPTPKKTPSRASFGRKNVLSDSPTLNSSSESDQTVQLQHITPIPHLNIYPERISSTTPSHHHRLINNPQLFPLLSRFSPVSLDSMLAFKDFFLESQASPTNNTTIDSLLSLLKSYQTTSTSSSPISTTDESNNNHNSNNNNNNNIETVFSQYETAILPSYESLLQSMTSQLIQHREFLAENITFTPSEEAEMIAVQYISDMLESGITCQCFPPSLIQYTPSSAEFADYNEATEQINNIKPKFLPQLIYPQHLIGFNDIYTAISSNQYQWSGSIVDLEPLEQPEELRSPTSPLYQDLGESGNWPLKQVQIDHPHCIPIRYAVEVNHESLPEKTTVPEQICYTASQWVEIVNRFPPLSYADAIIFRLGSSDSLYTLFKHLAPYLAAKNIHFVPLVYSSTLTATLIPDSTEKLKFRGFLPSDIYTTHFLTSSHRYTERSIHAYANGGTVLNPIWLLFSLLAGQLLPSMLEFNRTFHYTHIPDVKEPIEVAEGEESPQPQEETVVLENAFLVVNFAPIDTPLPALRQAQHRTMTSFHAIANKSTNSSTSSSSTSSIISTPNKSTKKDTKKNTHINTTLTVASKPKLSSLPRTLALPLFSLSNTVWFIFDGAETYDWMDVGYPSGFYGDSARKFIKSCGAIVLDIGHFIEALLCGFTFSQPGSSQQQLNQITNTPQSQSQSKKSKQNKSPKSSSTFSTTSTTSSTYPSLSPQPITQLTDLTLATSPTNSFKSKNPVTYCETETPFWYNWSYFQHKFNISPHTFHNPDVLQQIATDLEQIQQQNNEKNEKSAKSPSVFDLDPSNPFSTRHLDDELHNISEFGPTMINSDQLQAYPLFILTPYNVLDCIRGAILPYALQYKHIIEHNINAYNQSIINHNQKQSLQQQQQQSSTSTPTPTLTPTIPLPQSDDHYLATILSNACRVPWFQLSAVFDFCGKGRNGTTAMHQPTPAISTPINQRLIACKEQYTQIVNCLQPHNQ